MVHGYVGESFEQPYFMSRGQFDLTGSQEARAFELLQRTDELTSGLWGVSGVLYVRNKAEVYSDISGITGCIGCTTHRKRKDTDTGMTNINEPFARTKMGVLHMGFVKLPYVSGTLDGTVVALTWGDKLAPCQSGFRVFEDLNIDANTGLTTGVRQCFLGTYADTVTSITGSTTNYRIFLNPQSIYGVNK